jgi:hypothetical protein
MSGRYSRPLVASLAAFRNTRAHNIKSARGVAARSAAPTLDPRFFRSLESGEKDGEGQECASCRFLDARTSSYTDLDGTQPVRLPCVEEASAQILITHWAGNHTCGPERGYVMSA